MTASACSATPCWLALGRQALDALRAVALLGDGASIRFAIDNLASH